MDVGVAEAVEGVLIILSQKREEGANRQHLISKK